MIGPLISFSKSRLPLPPGVLITVSSVVRATRRASGSTTHARQPTPQPFALWPASRCWSRPRPRSPPASCRRSRRRTHYKVGFAQTESNNPWRLAETASMQDEAKKRGYQLVYTDAAGLGGQAGRRRQQHDRAEGRPDLPAAARGEAAGPGDHGRQEGRHPGDPARPQRRPVAGQGRRATTSPSSARTSSTRASASAEWLIKATGGKAKIIELEGTTGSSPANDRKKGFDDVIKQQSGHADPRQPVGRLRPRQGPPGRRDAAPGAPRGDRDLCPQRRDGARRDRGARGRRQEARQGRDRRLDRRREGRRCRRSSTARWARRVECNPRFGPEGLRHA